MAQPQGQNPYQTIRLGDREIVLECTGAGQPQSSRPLSDELYLCLSEGRCSIDELSLYRHIAQAYGLDICYARVGQTTYVYAPSAMRLYAVESHARYGVARCRPSDRRSGRAVCGSLEVRDVELAYSFTSLPNSDVKESPFIVAPDLAYPAIMSRIGRYMPRLSPDAARPYAYAVMPPNLEDLDAAVQYLKSVYSEAAKGGCADGDLPVRNVPRCNSIDAPVIDEVEA
jgi:hypothetical protein